MKRPLVDQNKGIKNAGRPLNRFCITSRVLDRVTKARNLPPPRLYWSYHMVEPKAAILETTLRAKAKESSSSSSTTSSSSSSKVSSGGAAAVNVVAEKRSSKQTDTENTKPTTLSTSTTTGPPEYHSSSAEPSPKTQNQKTGKT